MQLNSTMTPVLKERDCSQCFNLRHRRKTVSLREKDFILFFSWF